MGKTENMQGKRQGVIRPRPTSASGSLSLVLTLPNGCTQNIQFDFNLTKDDPIQVAKEMVLELEMPQEAVLEISEIVSGLVRIARIMREAKLQQHQQQQRIRIREQQQQLRLRQQRQYQKKLLLQ